MLELFDSIAFVSCLLLYATLNTLFHEVAILQLELLSLRYHLRHLGIALCGWPMAGHVAPV